MPVVTPGDRYLVHVAREARPGYRPDCVGAVCFGVADPSKPITARFHDGLAGTEKERGLVRCVHEDPVGLGEGPQRPGEVRAFGDVPGVHHYACDGRVVQAVGRDHLEDAPVSRRRLEPEGRWVMHPRLNNVLGEQPRDRLPVVGVDQVQHVAPHLL